MREIDSRLLAMGGLMALALTAGGVAPASAESVTTTDSSSRSVTGPGFSSTTNHVEETKRVATPVPRARVSAAPARAGGGTTEETIETEESTTTRPVPVPPLEQSTTVRSTETTTTR